MFRALIGTKINGRGRQTDENYKHTSFHYVKQYYNSIPKIYWIILVNKAFQSIQFALNS